jgi:peroxiredoxin
MDHQVQTAEETTVPDLARLSTQLDAVSDQVPAEIDARIAAAIAEVGASGTAPGLAVGDRAPGFRLPDATGKEVSLADRLDAGPVVLQFYRGDWCPYCNLHLRALQTALPEIRKRGASLIAISPQSPDHSLSLTEQAELEFDVLSDVDQHVIRDYRLQFTLPADLQSVHLNIFSLDLRAQNADGSWNLPVPATFVISPDGTIVTAGVQVDYRTRLEPSVILESLDALAS